MYVNIVTLIALLTYLPYIFISLFLESARTQRFLFYHRTDLPLIFLSIIYSPSYTPYWFAYSRLLSQGW